ncbi:hypothetical protein NKG05_09735 [Oerskovia sp. M15]
MERPLAHGRVPGRHGTGGGRRLHAGPRAGSRLGARRPRRGPLGRPARDLGRNAAGQPTADRNNPAVVAGAPISDNTMQNIYDTYIVENHGSFGPHYQSDVWRSGARNAIHFLLAGSRSRRSCSSSPTRPSSGARYSSSCPTRANPSCPWSTTASSSTGATSCPWPSSVRSCGTPTPHARRRASRAPSRTTRCTRRSTA